MTDLMAGEIIAVVLLLLVITYLLTQECQETEQTDVLDELKRVRIADDPTEEFDVWPEDLTAYGTVAVHRHCLDARRDGQRPCYICAPVLGVTV